MAKRLALTRRAQYLAVYESGKAFVDNVLVVKALPNNLQFSRVGYSVSKEIGTAVVRNHTKRWLKEAIRTLEIKDGWDIVIIARRNIVSTSYSEIVKSLQRQVRRAGLLEKDV
jgi:ribonuclease P protein component